MIPTLFERPLSALISARNLRSLSALVALVLSIASAHAQCTTDFADGYGFPGTDAVAIYCSAVYDSGDGTGAHLYVGGAFQHIGGVYANSIAMWNGTQWVPLVGTGKSKSFPGVYLSYHSSTTVHTFPAGYVQAMAVYNGYLYVGGQFGQVGPGGLSNAGRYNNLARWNGSAWSSVGPASTGTSGGLFGNFGAVAGAESPAVTQCSAMTVYDDGTGSQLYIAGYFAQAGGVSVSSIAKWDGSSFSPLAGTQTGGSQTDVITSLAVLNNNLYVGGFFTDADKVPNTQALAKYNTSGWSSIGSLDRPEVMSMVTFNDGTGTKLYIGGDFTTVADVPALGVAAYNDSAGTWAQVGAGLDRCKSLSVLGSTLYAAAFDGFERLSGLGWSQVPNAQPTAADVTKDVEWVGTVPAGTVGFTQPKLLVYGVFEHLGTTPAIELATYDGAAVSTLPATISLDSTASGGTPATVIIGSGTQLIVGDEGGSSSHGTALYAFGESPRAATNFVGTRFVARLDGSSWTMLDTFPGTSSQPVAAVFFNDGVHGSRLYVFTYYGGMFRWNGTTWDTILTEADEAVFSATVFDDGHGPAMYVAGAFDSFGGTPAQNIVKWDGSTWSALSANTFDGTIKTVTSYNGKLYIGGFFTHVSGVSLIDLAVFNGAGWSSVGSGITGSEVDGFAQFNGQLYVYGQYTSAGGQPASGLAAWDGTTWTPITGSTNAFITAATAGNDGMGAGLFVTGNFTSIGGVAAKGLAKLAADGTFTPVGTGLLQRGADAAWGSSMASVNNAVYIAGVFDIASSASNPARVSSGFAKWAAMNCCVADFNADGTTNVADIFVFLRAWFARNSSADIDGNGQVQVSDIFSFLRHWFARC